MDEAEPLTEREEMYLAVKAAGAAVEVVDTLPVLAVGRCSKDRGRCRRMVATMYATKAGPLMLTIVPDPANVLAGIDSPRARMQFAESRDEWLRSMTEWDLVDALLPSFGSWHPDVPTVICRACGPLPFDRDAFIAEGRRRRGRPIDIPIPN